MRNPEQHHRIVRYLRTPIIEVCRPEEMVSPKGMPVTEAQLDWFRPAVVRTLCLDSWDEPKSIMRVWELLAFGGHVIVPKLSDEFRKELRKRVAFEVVEEKPFFVIRKLSQKPGEVFRAKKESVRKTVCIVRYGGYGDHLMVTPLLDYYKGAGYKVVYNCTERGAEVFKGDPRIDELVVQETGVIPADGRLDAYWEKLATQYDVFVNLTGVVETSLLHAEGSPGYAEPWELRHSNCNKNYQDAHFEKAGLPLRGKNPTIWLSDLERGDARRLLERIKTRTGKSFVVLWNLQGSSFHKLYPWMYDVWTLAAYNNDDIAFIAVSDETGKCLESPAHKNVYPMSGKLSIRQTLALHSVVDAVVTPETNSLVAGLAFDAPVIAMLSHSSPDQYHWRPDDIALRPPLADCPCYPCHQMHFNRDSCPRGKIEASATLCMDSITPIAVYEALRKVRYKDDGGTVGAVSEGV